MIVIEGPSAALKKGINNAINTVNYLSGDRDTRYNFRYKSKDNELQDTAFKDFAKLRGFKYDAKTDDDNGMIQVSFDASRVPTELADKINPSDNNQQALYKYVKSYKDGKVVMEFPMVSKHTKNSRRRPSSESVMVPTPTPYRLRESNDDEDRDITVEPKFLEIKYEDDGEVKVLNKDTDISVMTDVKVTESLELNETPGLTMSSPKVKGAKLEIEINGKKYTYEVVDDNESADDVAQKVSKMQKFSDGKALAYLKKHMKLIREAAYVSEDFTGTGIDNLIVDIVNATRDYMVNEGGFPEDEVYDYFVVENDEDDERYRIEVRAELSYDGMRELANILDPMVMQYDRDAYFDDVTSGIIEAYLYKSNINPSMLESIKLESKYIGVEYTYDGDDTSDYLGHINVEAPDGDDKALEVAMDYITSTRPEVNPRDFKITKDQYKNAEYLDKNGKVINLKEGNSFKDHHICQGCGKPLSQCTCKVSEEDVDLSELDEDATQVSNMGCGKIDSIDLIDNDNSDDD